MGGIAVAPHADAARAAAAVLGEGGDAIEAMVAAAATIAVVYPHMNGIGGDAFWLVHEPGRMPRAIDACGPAGMRVDAAFYGERGLATIPVRGPLAANTVAGTVDGWNLAIAHSRATWGGRLPLARLLAPAIEYAERGIRVTRARKRARPRSWASSRTARVGAASCPGKVPAEGSFVQRPMGAALHRLARRA